MAPLMAPQLGGQSPQSISNPKVCRQIPCCRGCHRSARCLRRAALKMSPIPWSGTTLIGCRESRQLKTTANGYCPDAAAVNICRIIPGKRMSRDKARIPRLQFRQRSLRRHRRLRHLRRRISPPRGIVHHYNALLFRNPLQKIPARYNRPAAPTLLYRLVSFVNECTFIRLSFLFSVYGFCSGEPFPPPVIFVKTEYGTLCAAATEPANKTEINTIPSKNGVIHDMVMAFATIWSLIFCICGVVWFTVDRSASRLFAAFPICEAAVP